MNVSCRLTLSDGSSFEGEPVGAPINTSGEMVFTTGMVGYSEAITDPSYFGQVLVFAYPLIGNYGVPKFGGEVDYRPGFESPKIHASAVVFHQVSENSHHWGSHSNISDWLKSQNIPGIVGLDTRHLVSKIRSVPELFGKISYDPNVKDTRFKDKGQWFNPNAQEVMSSVSCSQISKIGSGPLKIGLIDLGVKWNIVRQLQRPDVEVTLVPWDCDFAKVDCHGWLISNGPGNPMMTGSLVQRVQELLNSSRPILGICLGHQILSIAAGASTSKMTFGHRSHNQPVREVGTRQGYITSQNHGFVVDNIPAAWEPWFTNVNDGSIEGIRHKQLPFRSVQFHPEAAGGPRDTSWIIDNFLSEVKNYATL